MQHAILLLMYIHVKAQPSAKKESFTQIDDTHFHIAVKEKAERNQANEKIIELLRAHFNTSNVRIINGHHSPSKLFSVGDDV